MSVTSNQNECEKERLKNKWFAVSLFLLQKQQLGSETKPILYNMSLVYKIEFKVPWQPLWAAGMPLKLGHQLSQILRLS